MRNCPLHYLILLGRASLVSIRSISRSQVDDVLAKENIRRNAPSKMQLHKNAQKPKNRKPRCTHRLTVLFIGKSISTPDEHHRFTRVMKSCVCRFPTGEMQEDQSPALAIFPVFIHVCSSRLQSSITEYHLRVWRHRCCSLAVICEAINRGSGETITREWKSRLTDVTSSTLR